MNASTPFQTARQAAMDIDLAPIKRKLMHAASGEGWSLDKANAVEKEYRRFLCLMKLYPDQPMAPLDDVDTFWHYHILDTMKYAADCERVFGHFLHHYPYVGMDGDERYRLDSGERLRALYEATFGEAYPWAPAGADEAIAFCAGPIGRGGGSASPAMPVAFCAGPIGRGGGSVDAGPRIAFCAGPIGKTGAGSAPAEQPTHPGH